jgi:outer membrane biosynthesis protein TonB
MSYFSQHKRGIIGTIIVHGVVLVVLLVFGFFTPLPLPGEEGIMVNFGNSENGLGEEEPAPGEIQSEPAIQEEKVTEPANVPVPPKVETPKPKPVKEEVMTQDLEKTAAIEAAKKKADEKKRQEELEKQRIEKERLAEIARQKAAEEAERKRKAEEQAKLNAINDRAKNVFGGGGKGAADSKSTGQGVTYQGGNQGNQNGEAGVNNYGQGGGVGNGISYSLGGWSAQSLPKPDYPGNEEGIVVVQVSVDKNGNVIKAEAGVKGSTSIDPQLLAAAKSAALKAKFNVDQNAPAVQQGTITYRFVLD